jgi:hypothetical protein
MGFNERLKAIEVKAGTKTGPTVIVYENNSVPEGTPPDAIILRVVYDGNARGSQPDGHGDSRRNRGRRYERH